MRRRNESSLTSIEILVLLERLYSIVCAGIRRLLRPVSVFGVARSSLAEVEDTGFVLIAKVVGGSSMEIAECGHCGRVSDLSELEGWTYSTPSRDMTPDETVFECPHCGLEHGDWNTHLELSDIIDGYNANLETK